MAAISRISLRRAFFLLSLLTIFLIFITSSWNTSTVKDDGNKNPQKNQQIAQRTMQKHHHPPKKKVPHKRNSKGKRIPWKADVVRANKIKFQNREWPWPYHKLYPVNCTAIFAGDEAAIKDSGKLLRLDGRKIDMLPVPSDDRVRSWLHNCTEFKTNRGYPQEPLSQEEAEYPIAYSIVSYKDSSQVERLLRSIYHPQNVYCVHVDTKSTALFVLAIRELVGCFDNVFISSTLESVEWGNFSAVKADLHCMKDLLVHPIQWKYVLNLCGMDFPLKTNLEIVRQLKEYNGHNCIEGYIDTRFPNRTKFSSITGKRKRPPPHDIIAYKGDTYIAATRGFVDFFVNHQVSKDYLEWLKDTTIPDEYFTSALNRLTYAPGGSPIPSMECNVRYRKWKHKFKFPERPQCKGKYVHHLCIFRSGYLQYLHRAPHLFVNKFHYNYDPVAMQCLQEMLDYRTLHPEEYYLWEKYKYPVTNYSWQFYTSDTYIPGLPASELKPMRIPSESQLIPQFYDTEISVSNETKLTSTSRPKTSVPWI